MARPAKDPITRFMAYVKPVANGCHEWQAKRDKQGYGHFTKRPGVQVRAHRFAWEIANGEIPAGLWVLHKCDNTCCVNPEHLFVGTCSDNVQDSISKGRFWGRRSLEDHEVVKAIEMLASGSSQESIADELCVHQTTISRIKRRANQYVNRTVNL